jgi:hypothetical protein
MAPSLDGRLPVAASHLENRLILKTYFFKKAFRKTGDSSAADLSLYAAHLLSSEFYVASLSVILDSRICPTHPLPQRRVLTRSRDPLSHTFKQSNFKVLDNTRWAVHWKTILYAIVCKRERERERECFLCESHPLFSSLAKSHKSNTSSQT